MTMKTKHILLVEDNDGDILLTKEAFENSVLIRKISVVKNGKDAIDFLSQNGQFLDTELPDFVLLDINLPKKNGHEVLKYIKTNPKTRHIPVTIFTTSSTPKDINLAYELHANCYVTKPIDVKSFQDTLTQIELFWFNLVQLPFSSQHHDYR